MKIAIAGGRSKADFLIRSLLGKKHSLVVINDDMEYCNFLAQSHRIPVICGDPCKRYVTDEAEIENFDLLIALLASDADNLAVCQTARLVYHIPRVVAVVSNPKNVEVFKKLGVSNAISATYMVAGYIEQASTVENLVSTFSVEHGKIVITELLVNRDCPVCDQQVMDVAFGDDVIVGCIIRGTEMIVPNGRTVIRANDKLLILSPSDCQEHVIRSVMGGN